jgi:hypothetical protein
MRGRPKITRIQLGDPTNEESIFLGIVSAEADYKLSHLLNKKLGIALRNNKALEVMGVDGSQIYFSRYSDTSGSPELTYNLISNKSDKDYLLKKFKRIDYLFQIHRTDNKPDIDELIGSLREIERITAVFKLDQREIKDKNLIYLTI